MHYTHNQFDNMAPAVSPFAVAPVADYGHCGYGYPVAPATDYGHCGYGYPAVAGHGGNGTFVLVVVLFILLIIIGCSCGNW